MSARPETKSTQPNTHTLGWEAIVSANPACQKLHVGKPWDTKLSAHFPMEYFCEDAPELLHGHFPKGDFCEGAQKSHDLRAPPHGEPL